MRNTNLGNQERLTRVSYPSNELSQRFELGVLNLLDAEIRGEEVRLVPVVHLETSERPLHLALRIQVNPSHAIGHDHLANLSSQGFTSNLVATERQSSSDRCKGLGARNCAGWLTRLAGAEDAVRSGRIARGEELFEDTTVGSNRTIGIPGRD
jgi:hypothetical protein